MGKDRNEAKKYPYPKPYSQSWWYRYLIKPIGYFLRNLLWFIEW